MHRQRNDSEILAQVHVDKVHMRGQAWQQWRRRPTVELAEVPDRQAQPDDAAVRSERLVPRSRRWPGGDHRLLDTEPVERGAELMGMGLHPTDGVEARAAPAQGSGRRLEDGADPKHPHERELAGVGDVCATVDRPLGNGSANDGCQDWRRPRYTEIWLSSASV